jgi:hypothetical protein
MKTRYVEAPKPAPTPPIKLIAMEFVRVIDGEEMRTAAPGDVLNPPDANEFWNLVNCGRVAMATEENVRLAQARRKIAIEKGQIEK